MQSALHARPVPSPTVSGRQLPPLFIVPLLLAATALPRFVSREPSLLPMSARVRLRVVRGPSMIFVVPPTEPVKKVGFSGFSLKWQVGFYGGLNIRGEIAAARHDSKGRIPQFYTLQLLMFSELGTLSARSIYYLLPWSLRVSCQSHI